MNEQEREALPPLPFIGAIHTDASGKVVRWPAEYKRELLAWWGKGARAALAATPAPAPAGWKMFSVPVQWTPGADWFKDWAANWFGPDVDDEHIRRAVADLLGRAPSQGTATPAQAQPNQWRDIALKFDAQRMAAISHLRMMLQDPAAHADTVREFLSQSPSAALAANVLAGWKLVPVEPTEAMFTAFSRQIDEGVVYVGGFVSAYRHMLAATPPAPAPEATPAQAQQAVAWQSRSSANDQWEPCTRTYYEQQKALGGDDADDVRALAVISQ